MKTVRQEKLLPVLINNKREEHSKIMLPEFTGTINVNPLRLKQKNPLDLKLDLFEEPKNEKNKKVFANYKQEQHYRLNRDHKLKVNDEICSYIKNTKNRPDTVGSVRKYNIKNEKEQMKEAAKQLEEIHYILEHNKNNPNKIKEPFRNNLEGLSFLDEKINKRMPSESNLKHLCTKGLRNKLTHYNATNLDRKTRQNENRIEKHISTADMLNSTGIVSKIRNPTNKASIKNAIDALNVRLANSKDKILSDYEASVKKSKEKMAEFDALQRKQRTSKYKSIKDVRLNVGKVRDFENELKIKKKQTEDPKEMKLLYKNEIFQTQDNVSENQFEKPDFPEKYKKFLTPNEDYNEMKIKVFSDNIEKETYNKKSPKKEMLCKELEKDLQKFQNLDLKLTKDINLSPRGPRKSPKSPRTIVRNPDTISKGVGDEGEPNDLEKSILQSDYLTKEFHLDSGKFGEGQNDNIVNWADKFKVVQPRKWTKDFEYFLA